MMSDAQKSPRRLLDLSTEEKCKFLESFDYVFSDIDGVAFNHYADIENAPEGYQELKKSGKKMVFITNNSVRPVSSNMERLNSLNLNFDENDLWHPAKAVVQYLNNIKFSGLIYVIGSESFKNILKEAGYNQMIYGPNEIIPESMAEMGKHVFDGQPVRAVIMDFDYNVSSAKLMRSHIYLRHPECLLIVGATDMLMPVRPDINIIGPGPFAKVIAEASSKSMITLGKPGLELAKLLQEYYRVQDPSRILMIGDMMEQDVSFGRKCNYQTLLVLSGGTKLQDMLNEKQPDFLPDYYAESVGDFVEFFKDINKSKV